MNIIIPLCGRGTRFEKYTHVPKPLIKVFNKEIIKYTFGCIGNRKVFLVYTKHLKETSNIEKVLSRFKNITHVVLDDYTCGPVETIKHVLPHIDNTDPCLIMDGDGFYTTNIFKKIKKLKKNLVVYYEDKHKSDDNLYSNIVLGSLITRNIVDIDEKRNISNYINTGAYCFESKNLLEKYCDKVLKDCKEKSIEPYTSFLIKEMINNGILFTGFNIQPYEFVSLGTPEQILEYRNYFKQNFLFDLDGTIVNSDYIYYNVWEEILKKYNKKMTCIIYKDYIYGKNDKAVCKKLLNIKDEEEIKSISTLKDSLFLKQIDSVKQIKNSISFINFLKKHGAYICVVTNCNRNVAKEILKHFNLNVKLIASEDCKRQKPYPDPYEKALENRRQYKTIIFEDSLTGITSAKATSPECIVGIKTDEGDVRISDFSQMNIYKNFFNRNKIADIQVHVSRIMDREIILKPLKLKGGFIADVYDGNEIIFKMQNNSENALSYVVNSLDLYAKENYFYTRMYKQVSKIINLPKYYGIVDKPFCKGLILENLYSSRYKFQIKTEVSPRICNNIIDEITKLHLFYWNEKTNLKENKKTIKFMKKFMVEKVDEFLEKWGNTTTKANVEKCKRAIENLDSITNRLYSDKNMTICHGDVKLGNVFLSLSDIPFFIDWQYVSRGKGVTDLVFFLIESLDIDYINKERENLVQRYYNRVNHVYEKEDFDKDFEAATWFYPFFVAIWFGTLNYENLLNVEFPETFISRFFNFIK